jgi:O-antigen ligase
VNHFNTQTAIWSIRLGWKIVLIFAVSYVLLVTSLILVDRSDFAAPILALCIIASIIQVSSQRLTPTVGFLFGTSLFLLGHAPNSIQSHILTMVVGLNILTALSFSQGHKERNAKIPPKSSITMLVLFAISLQAIFSLTRLPLPNFTSFWSAGSFLAVSKITLSAEPGNYLYSIAEAVRLSLYIGFAYLLTLQRNAKETLIGIFFGLFTGCVAAVALGLLDYFRVIDLSFYRALLHDPSVGAPYRLQSTFGHAGWFAQYVCITVPMVIYAFLASGSRRSMAIPLFGILILIEMALILAQARAGWTIYPLTIFACWFLYYRQGRDSALLSPKVLFSALVSIPVTLVASVLIVLALGTIIDTPIASLGDELIKRAVQTADTNARAIEWRDGLLVALEAPIFGMGYESFRWSADVLTNIPTSFLKEAHLRSGTSNVLPTPHNLYINMLVNGGLMMLLLWVFATGRALFVLSREIFVNSNLYSIPVFVGIITFHVYGLFQSMSYVSSTWIVIFVFFAYSATIEAQSPNSKYLEKVQKLLMLFVLAAGSNYLLNLFSSDIAERYNQQRLFPHETIGKFDFDNSLGFYPLENWPNGQFRWTGKTGVLNNIEGGYRRIYVQIAHPDISNQNPVQVSYSADNEQLGVYRYRKAGLYEHDFYFDSKSELHTLATKVSRTFRPYDYNPASKDKRELGIALSQVLKGPEPRKIDLDGFYPKETRDDGVTYQWSSLWGVRKVNQPGSAVQLTAWVEHPNLKEEPLTLRIEDQHGLTLESFTFKDNGAKSLVINTKSDTSYLFFKPDRTFTPSLSAESSDSRSLGVAIAWQTNVSN